MVIEQVAQQVSGPWIILGDFNMYRYAHEKSNGGNNWVVMDRFNSWIRDAALDDIHIENRQYTGSNKRARLTLIKLDRVLVNAEWNLAFLNCTASAVTTTTSDHVPIVVEFSQDKPKCSLFRFENH